MKKCSCLILIVNYYYHFIIRINLQRRYICIGLHLCFVDFFLLISFIDPFQVWNSDRFDSFSSLSATVEMFKLFSAGGIGS